MPDPKHVPGPNPLQSVVGPHATIDEKHGNQGSGMPAVGVAGLGYSLPARADGMIYARPIIVTSVKSERQLVTGHVFIEAGDTEPTAEGTRLASRHHYEVRDIPMGNPSEPNKCHWLAKNYMGRSDGQGLTPIGSTEVTEDVPTGNETPPPTPVAPAPGIVGGAQTVDPADTDKDGTVSAKEAKKQKKLDRSK